MRYNATFVSVWDGGYKVKSRCHVNKRSQMVTAIGKNDNGDNDGMLEILEKEYVKLDGDEKEYPARSIEGVDEKVPGEFYYE
jgi:hypothetical protein